MAMAAVVEAMVEQLIMGSMACGRGRMGKEHAVRRKVALGHAQHFAQCAIARECLLRIRLANKLHALLHTWS